jgi:23S rRNA (uridine2552-2'-O)-methyltransferase
MRKKASSRRWLDEHHSDHYVKMARTAGYRSRAVFKLEEIDAKDHLLRPGMLVVDLGAAPGGWSQFVVKRLKDKGQVVALDILPIEPMAGVAVIEGDFREPEPLQELADLLGNERVDLVLSDMAPNMTGVAPADQAASMYLAELALEFAKDHLTPKGAFLVKVFQGEGFDGYLKEMRASFKTVSTRKPQASRGRSKELYLLAQGLRLV